MVGSTHRRFPFDFNSRPFDSSPGPQTNLGLHAQEYSFPFFLFFHGLTNSLFVHTQRDATRERDGKMEFARERKRGGMCMKI